MKRVFIHILYVAACCAMYTSCAKSEISTYALEDCAVAFVSPTNSYSLKGMSEATRDLSVPVELIGIPADYDREIAIEIGAGTAQLDKDYVIVSKCIPAGAVRGNIVLRVNKFAEGTEELSTSLSIVPNEFFRAGPLDDSSAEVTWSEAYNRPRDEVWRYWYTFICHGYSREYHRLLVEYFGEEVETYTNNLSYAKNDPSLVYKLPTWWYNANREFRDYVRNHDSANPGSPWRHSDDYELYNGWGVARGAGTTPEQIPTILETLIAL